MAVGEQPQGVPEGGAVGAAAHHRDRLVAPEEPANRRAGNGFGLGHVVNVEAGNERACEWRVDGADVVADDEDTAATGHVVEPGDVQPAAEDDRHQGPHHLPEDRVHQSPCAPLTPRSRQMARASAIISSTATVPVSMTWASGAG